VVYKAGRGTGGTERIPRAVNGGDGEGDGRQTAGMGRWCALLLAVVVAAGVGLRLYRLDLPPAEYHPWRQTDTAAMARWMYRGPLDPFHPRVDWAGRDGGPVEAEFQLYTFLVACLWRVVGYHERWARALSCGASLAALGCMVWLGRRLGLGGFVVVAAVVFCLSPLGVILGRTVQPESLWLFLSLAALCRYRRHLDGPATGASAAAAGALLALALLVKVPALYLGVPFLVMTVSVRGWSGFRQGDVWAVALVGLLPAVAWYAYAHTFPESFGIWTGGGTKYGSVALLLDPATWSTFRRFVLILLPWPWLVLVALGLVAAVVDRQHLLLSWGAGLGLLWLVAARGFSLHNYYFYPFLPWAALVCAYGVRRVGDGGGASPWRRRLSVVGAALLLVAGPVTQWRTFTLLAYEQRAEADELFAAARHVQRVTAPDALVVTSVPRNGPQLLYFADRRGWYCSAGEATKARLTGLAARGASWYAWYVPVLAGCAVGLGDQRSLHGPVRAVQGWSEDLNVCFGEATGFHAVVALAPVLPLLGNDDETVAALARREIRVSLQGRLDGATVVEVARRYGLDGFAMPLDTPLADRLTDDDGWRCMYFDDQGVVYGMVDGPAADVVSRRGYLCLAPTRAPWYLRRGASSAQALVEARRAVIDAPASVVAFSVLGALLWQNERWAEALDHYGNAEFVDRCPRLCLVNQLQCAVRLDDRTRAFAVAVEVARRWPDEDLARQVLAQLVGADHR